MSPPSIPPPGAPGRALALGLLVAAAMLLLVLAAGHATAWWPPRVGGMLEAALHMAPALLVIGLLARALVRERELRRQLANALESNRVAMRATGDELASCRAEITFADELIRSLADSAPVGIFHSRLDGRRYANRQWGELTGLTMAESQGDGWQRGIHPEDRARVAAGWETAIRERRPWRSEHRLINTQSGVVRWVLVQTVPFRGEGSDLVPGCVGSITDITEQKLRERVLRVLSTEAATLTGRSFFERVTAELSEVCEADVAIVCRLLGEPRNRARTLALRIDGELRENIEYTLADTPCERVIEGGFVGIAAELATRYPRDGMLAKLGLESYAAVGLHDAGGQLIGHLGVMSRRPLPDVARLESWLRLFAVPVAAELERERTEQRFEALFEFAPDAIVLTDARGVIQRVNQQAVRLFGYSRAELAGQPVELLVPDMAREAHRRQRHNYVATAAPRAMGEGRAHLSARRKDGTVFPADISLGSLESADGLLVLAAVRDVTEKRRAAEALRESEEWLRTVFENSPECVKVLDRDGRVLQINGSGVRILGARGAEQVRGLCLAELIEPGQRGAFMDFLDALCRGEARRGVFEVTTFTGERRWCEAHGAPLWATPERREVKSILAVSRDITSEREIERMMQALLRRTAAVLGEEYLRSVVRELGETLGPDQVFVAVKEPERPGWLRTLAYFKAGHLSENFSYDSNGGPCAEVLKRDAPLHLPERACDHFSAGVCGQRNVGAYYGMPLHDAAREPIGLLVVANERVLNLAPVMQSLLLTFALRAEAELVRLQAEREKEEVERQLFQSQKLEALGTLAGGVAHDFNNLLTGIINYTTLAHGETGDPATCRRYLEQVLGGSQRAKDLVRQILMFSRQEPPRREPVWMGRLIEEVRELLRALAPANVTLETKVAPGLPPVSGDSTQLHQVLMNLALNAVHAMKREGGQLTVRAEAVTVAAGEAPPHRDLLPGRYVWLEVRDTGCGIEPVQQARVFEPFYTTKRVGEGSGLGLSVVHGIVRNHGGAIRLHSEVGKGTAFSVYLPVLEQTADPTAAPVAPRPASPARILLVDDEPGVLESTQAILRQCGADVTACESADRALAQFWARPAEFDLVVADLRMRGMNGVDLVRRILAQRPEVPVVIVSGFLGEWTTDALQTLGVRRVVEKPVSPDGWRQLIAELVLRA